ncbi:MAG: antibiotic biosynthesis monooxygenase [Desulfobacteraceae bacterium]|jgi:heme-degrading monooxygenase HmoA|nr:antibiotic biosynthesis monooxygenase [Desulfobacteraceae bacterium]
MAVKILIKRKVPGHKSEELSKLLKHLRALTMIQPGYISGETLDRVDVLGQSLVISTWQSVESWRTWVLSKERQEIQGRIDELLGEETTYEIYEYQ